jgi:hypothetical protein
MSTSEQTHTSSSSEPVKVKRKTAGGRKKKVAADQAEKQAPATTITAPVSATTTAKRIRKVNGKSLFVQARRPVLKKEFPDLKNDTEKLATKLQEEWDALDSKARADYELQADAKNKEKEAAKAAASSSSSSSSSSAPAAAIVEPAKSETKKGRKRKAKTTDATATDAAAPTTAIAPAAEEKKKTKKSGKKTKDKDAKPAATDKPVSNIKRPMTSFMIFTSTSKQEKAPVQIGADGKEIKQNLGNSGKRMGERWNAMTDEEKQPYADKAKIDNDRYKREKSEWDIAHPEPPKQQTRALSAYILFTKEERPKIKDENKDLGFTDVGKELGVRWRKIEHDVAARKKYDDEHDRQVGIYGGGKKAAKAAEKAARAKAAAAEAAAKPVVA